MPTNGGRPLHEIETWIFDLDNTLYPASCRLFDQIHDRMQRFIAERLNLSLEEALVVQKTYFREHGTTMRGLMTVDKVDPHEFLAYVHEIDLACVPPDPVLAAALAALPGRKIVHTNGSVRHAERLLTHLEVAEFVLRHCRHRRCRVRAQAGARRLPRIIAAPWGAATDRADDRRHGQEPGPGRSPRHDYGLDARHN